MAIMLDHVFILVEPGAKVADRLLEQGFREGPSNTYPGQGKVGPILTILLNRSVSSSLFKHQAFLNLSLRDLREDKRPLSHQVLGFEYSVLGEFFKTLQAINTFDIKPRS